MGRHHLRAVAAATLSLGLSSIAASAAEAPPEIKLGTLYASSGRLASISMPVYDGLKLWLDQKNAEGGVLVKPFNKKIPLKLVAYDDQSNTGTAATLYNQLITQDKVDILIADSSSVLTSVAVPIARDHKMLLIDQTGTGATFFTPDNPYIVLMSDPVSSIWPKPLADFITQEGPKLGIKKVAMIYATNDFTTTQANAVRKFIKEANSGIDLVYDQGVPTDTSSYTVLINNIRARNPDAVIHLGYAPNDIAFLRNLQDSGVKFKMLFCIYPGLETELLEKNVGDKGLNGIFTYVPSSEIAYKSEFGMSLPEFKKAWDKKYGEGKVEFGFNSVAGYTTGLVLEKALSVTDSMDQLALRKAIFSLSGKLKTLDGTFALDQNGAQIGEITPLGQLKSEDGHIKFVTVFPHDVANGKPIYPAP
ncbi:MAG TPA: amino acid ABC transporter substrate-binding protein [Stellaceae bacterium]|nr:amino acid ABC transporter substrate-binding protein [Stellaceae bacterium]